MSTDTNEDEGEIFKRIIRFYATLCPHARIEVHTTAANQDSFEARVVVMDPNDRKKVLCVLAERYGHSPRAALQCLFGDFDGPIFTALTQLKAVVGVYRDLVVVELPKEGTRVHTSHKSEVEALTATIVEATLKLESLKEQSR